MREETWVNYNLQILFGICGTLELDYDEDKRTVQNGTLQTIVTLTFKDLLYDMTNYRSDKESYYCVWSFTELM